MTKKGLIISKKGHEFIKSGQKRTYIIEKRACMCNSYTHFTLKL